MYGAEVFSCRVLSLIELRVPLILLYVYNIANWVSNNFQLFSKFSAFHLYCNRN